MRGCRRCQPQLLFGQYQPLDIASQGVVCHVTGFYGIQREQGNKLFVFALTALDNKRIGAVLKKLSHGND